MAIVEADYDYIVIGAGSAGCVIASRLSENPHANVLLVEAGGRSNSILIAMPGANGLVVGHPRYDWIYRTEPQQHLAGRRIYWPRGRGLGGTSIINGMVYIRGNRRDYDAWAANGLAGWSFDDVLPYFKKSEGSFRDSGPFHSTDGPLKTSRAGNYGPLDDVFLNAASQAGLAVNDDFNGERQSGFGTYDVNVHRGRRMDAASAFLSVALRRRNLRVLTHSVVLKIVFEGYRARGIQIGGLRGSLSTINATREIILSMGAVATPQLMMISGLGPADELRRLGIGIVQDIPGVGQGLQDHLQVPIQFACTAAHLTFDRYQRVDLAAWIGLRYLLTRKGPAAAPFWSTGGFVTLRGADDHPHLQYFFTPMCVTEDPLLSRKSALAGFQIDVSLMRPLARGEIKLKSSDPREHPLINPRYFSVEEDRRDLVAGLGLARDIVAAKAFDAVRGEEYSLGVTARTDADIMEGIRHSCISGYHPVGTCRMGSQGDRTSVTDALLRVVGVEGLRIADASIMPSIPAGNTNAPVIMIAEKAADLVKVVT